MSGNGLGDLARKAWERSPHPPGQTESDCEETIRRHVDASKYTVKALGGYLEVTGTPGPFWELDTAVPAFVARRKGERETEELRRKEALARLLFAVPKGHVALHSGGRTGVVWVVTSGKVTVKTDPPEIEFVDLTTLEEFREWAFVPREDLVQTAKIR